MDPHRMLVAFIKPKLSGSTVVIFLFSQES